MRQRKKLKNNLQLYRKWKGLSRKTLSEKIKISASQIRLIEYQKCTPNIRHIASILNYFNLSFHQMFFEEGDF